MAKLAEVSLQVDVLKQRGCAPAACGLVMPAALSLDAWAAIGRALGHQQDTIQWRIGDWWNYPGHRYGERTAVVEAEDWDGPSASTCANAGTVARAFQTSRRREVLSFKHHAEVAHLSPPEAERLLDWCEEPLATGGKARSTRELREEIKRRMARRVEKMEAAAYPSPLAEPRVVTLRVECSPPREDVVRLRVDDVELPGPKVLHLEQPPPSSAPPVRAASASADAEAADMLMATVRRVEAMATSAVMRTAMQQVRAIIEPFLEGEPPAA